MKINKIRTMLILQGIFNAIYILGGYVAILRMPLGDAMTVVFSTPLPTIFFARIFVGQRLRVYKFMCALLLVIGLILILRPPFLFGIDHFSQIKNETSNINDTQIPMFRLRILPTIYAPFNRNIISRSGIRTMVTKDNKMVNIIWVLLLQL